MTTLAIIGEDATHAALVHGLVSQTVRDVALAAGVVWLVDAIDGMAPLVEWQGTQDLGDFIAGLRYFKRADAVRSGKLLGHTMQIGGRPIKLRGFIDDQPQRVDAHEWRLALVGVLADEHIEAVIAVRDTDGDRMVLDGLRQAAGLMRRTIVICAPHQDAEGWLVLGLGAAERRPAVAAALGFCPVREPHRLTASPNHAATDAKRVLRRLLFDDDRSAALTREELAAHLAGCLPDASIIAAHGSECGIADFCDGIRQQIAPLFDPALAPR